MSTLKDLAKAVVAKHQLKQRDAEVFVNAVVDTIIEGLQNDRLVKIKGFGTFKLTAVRDRESVNVNTGERVVISGHDKISFTPDAVMRDVINKPFAQFETVVLADGVSFEDEVVVEDDSETDEEATLVENVAISKAFETDSVGGENDNLQGEESLVVNEEVDTQTVDNAVSSVESEYNQPSSADDLSVSSLDDDGKADRMQEESKVQSLDAYKSKVIENNTPEFGTSDNGCTGAIDQIGKDDGGVSETVDSPEETSDVLLNGEELHEANTIEQKMRIVNNVNSDNKNIADEPIDEDISEVEFEQEEKSSNAWLYAIVSNILIAALFFILGYLCHSNKWLVFSDDSSKNEDIKEIVDVIPSNTTDTIKQDSVKNISGNKGVVDQSDSSKDVNETNAVSDNTKNDQINNNVVNGVPDQSAYNRDARVRTGAYYIVGTTTTVSVRAGQTTKSLSKTYLGDGMECYIEAYNGGVTELKEGMTVKIPKLLLKKKAKK